jgi:sec-independent protein translocase protein TatA
MEILLVLLIALIVFGPKRIPELGQSLGRGIREFKSAIEGNDGQPEQGTPGTDPEARAEIAGSSQPESDASPQTQR